MSGCTSLTPSPFIHFFYSTYRVTEESSCKQLHKSVFLTGHVAGNSSRRSKWGYSGLQSIVHSRVSVSSDGNYH